MIRTNYHIIIYNIEAHMLIKIKGENEINTYIYQQVNDKTSQYKTKLTKSKYNKKANISKTNKYK